MGWSGLDGGGGGVSKQEFSKHQSNKQIFECDIYHSFSHSQNVQAITKMAAGILSQERMKVTPSSLDLVCCLQDVSAVSPDIFLPISKTYLCKLIQSDLTVWLVEDEKNMQIIYISRFYYNAYILKRKKCENAFFYSFCSLRVNWTTDVRQT